MKCPKCSYVSHDYLDDCRKCGVDLLAFKQQVGLLVLQPGELDLSLALAGSMSDDQYSQASRSSNTGAMRTSDDDFDISLDDYPDSSATRIPSPASRPQDSGRVREASPMVDHLTLELDAHLSAEVESLSRETPAPSRATDKPDDAAGGRMNTGHLTLELDLQDFEQSMQTSRRQASQPPSRARTSEPRTPGRTSAMTPQAPPASRQQLPPSSEFSAEALATDLPASSVPDVPPVAEVSLEPSGEVKDDLSLDIPTIDIADSRQVLQFDDDAIQAPQTSQRIRPASALSQERSETEALLAEEYDTLLGEPSAPPGIDNPDLEAQDLFDLTEEIRDEEGGQHLRDDTRRGELTEELLMDDTLAMNKPASLPDEPSVTPTGPVVSPAAETPIARDLPGNRPGAAQAAGRPPGAVENTAEIRIQRTIQELAADTFDAADAEFEFQDMGVDGLSQADETEQSQRTIASEKAPDPSLDQSGEITASTSQPSPIAEHSHTQAMEEPPSAAFDEADIAFAFQSSEMRRPVAEELPPIESSADTTVPASSVSGELDAAIPPDHLTLDLEVNDLTEEFFANTLDEAELALEQEEAATASLELKDAPPEGVSPAADDTVFASHDLPKTPPDTSESAGGQTSTPPKMPEGPHASSESGNENDDELLLDLNDLDLDDEKR